MKRRKINDVSFPALSAKKGKNERRMRRENQ
jgi:hypothetical protein